MESEKDVSMEEEKQDNEQISVLKNLRVEELKEIEKITTADQIKIQKAKEKIAERIQQMQNKVDEYFGRIDLDKLGGDPDEPKENKKFSKKLKESKTRNALQASINEIENDKNTLEIECRPHKDLLIPAKETLLKRIKIKNFELCEELINQLYKSLDHEICRIDKFDQQINEEKRSSANSADFSSALQIKNDTKKRIKKCNKNLTAIKDLVTDIRFKLNTISGDGVNTSNFENISEDYCSEKVEAKKVKNKGLEYIDHLQRIQVFNNCDRLAAMIEHWESLGSITFTLPKLANSIDYAFNQKFSNSLYHQTTESVNQDVELYRNTIGLLNNYAWRLDRDIESCQFHHESRQFYINQKNAANLAMGRFESKITESSKSQQNYRIENLQYPIEETKGEVETNSLLAADAILEYLTPYWNQINSLTSKILGELEILEVSARNLNLIEDKKLINFELSNLKSSSKLNMKNIKKAMFNVNNEILTISSNLFKSIRQELSLNPNESYEERKSSIPDQDCVKDCFDYAYKLFPKVSELETYLLDIEKLQDQLPVTSQSETPSYDQEVFNKKINEMIEKLNLLGEVKEQLNSMKSNFKNYCLFEFDNKPCEQKDTLVCNLGNKVAQMIDKVCETNKVIEKYNQTLRDSAEQTKKTKTKLAKQLIVNKESLEFVNRNLKRLKKAQKKINKINDKYTEIAKIKKEVVDLYTQEFKGCTIIIRKNDLTKEYVDAIVNPANEQLEHAGGAAYAILCAGGDTINEESRSYIREHGRLPTSCATMTSAGSLPCKAVIHAVGPRFNETAIDHTFEEILMKKTITSILDIVVENDYKSVSIPAISTGIFKFPLTRFAVTCTKAIKEFVSKNEQNMKNRQIILCNFDDDTTNRLLEVVPKVLELKEETNSNDSNTDKHNKNKNESEDSENEKLEESGDKIKKCKQCKSNIKNILFNKKGKKFNLCKKCIDAKASKDQSSSSGAESSDDEQKVSKKAKKRRKVAKERSQSLDQSKQKTKNAKKNKKNRCKSSESDSESDKSEEEKLDKKRNRKNKKKDSDSEEKIETKKKLFKKMESSEDEDLDESKNIGNKESKVDKKAKKNKKANKEDN